MHIFKKLNTHRIAFKYLLEEEKASNVKTPFLKKIKYLLKGFSSEKYFIYNFTENNYKNYLSDYQRRKTFRINNNYSIIINDKNLFAKLLEGTNLIPKYFGYIQNGHISLEQKPVSFNDFINLVKQFQNIIVKQKSGGGGKGIYKISYINDYYYMDDEIISKEKLKDFISNCKDHLIQEYIIQAEYSRSVFSGTINTIRILVMRDPNTKRTFIATAVHKFGSEKTKPADNVRKGGMTALVDLETGILQRSAFHENNNKTIQWKETHPDTNVKIEGIKVPNWNEVKRQILDLSNELSYLNYVGWDVVVTDDGIKVIEGNNYSDVNILQIHKPLLVDDRVKEFYRYHNIIK